MKTQIITIGDEILIGQTLNTNAAFIGEKLLELNITPSKASIIADEKSEIIKEFTNAYAENDLIIVTGGLGPTHDDLTLECIVEFFNTSLILNNDVLDDIKLIFEKRGKQITATNERQAYVPLIATPIRNYKGTAPGIWIEKNGKIFVAMPGVPFEMQEMMNYFVIPTLHDRIGNKGEFLYIKNLLTTGIPESYLFDKLGDLDELLNGAKLAFLPSQYGVKMRINVTAATEEDAKNKLSGIEQKIRTIVGRNIYGTDNETIEHVIGKMLNERGLQISVAESCTGGLISNRITNIPGSSTFFERGYVTYSNAAKVELLNVDEDVIQQFGAVSFQVAMQMAQGVRAVCGTDIGLSITGILGPTGATINKQVGLVYVGICDEKICTAVEFKFGDDRLLNKERASQAALDLLRRHLLGIPYNE
ncbi:MAG: competence/damage-inducible protein A [bacterium]